MTSEVTTNLHLLVDRASEVYNAWVADSDVRYVTEPVEMALDQMVEYFDLSDIPAEVRPLATAVAGFKQAWERFKRDALMRRDADSAMPGPALFKLLAIIFECREQARPRPRIVLETIDELTQQKVSDAQICRIYEWTEGDGSPQLWKIREERAEPGKHTTGYVPPSQRRREAMEDRRRKIIDSVRHQAERKHTAATAVAPETTEELIEQGLSAAQIANMKRITTGQVMQAADEAGLPRPPLHYDPLTASRGTYDQDLSDEARRILDARTRPASMYREQPSDAEPADDAGESLEQEVIGYFDRGTTDAAEIAKLVSTEAFPVSRQKVQAIVKRYQSNPRAFQEA